MGYNGTMEMIEIVESICDDAAALGNTALLKAISNYMETRRRAIGCRMTGRIAEAVQFEAMAEKLREDIVDAACR